MDSYICISGIKNQLKMMLSFEKYSTICARSIACEQDIMSIEVITKALTAMDLRFHECIIHHKQTSRLR